MTKYTKKQENKIHEGEHQSSKTDSQINMIELVHREIKRFYNYVLYFLKGRGKYEYVKTSKLKKYNTN